MRCTRGEFLVLIAMSVLGIISSLLVIYELDVVHTLPPFCIEGSASSGITINCAKVLLSQYSQLHIGPLSVSVDMLAAVWFIINIFLVVMVTSGSIKYARPLFDVLFMWRFFGLIVVPYMVYLELFVVKSICIYCTIMHVAIIIDFIIITYLLFSKASRIRACIIQDAPNAKATNYK